MKEIYNRIIVLTKDSALWGVILKLNKNLEYKYTRAYDHNEAIGYIRSNDYRLLLIDMRFDQNSCEKFLQIALKDYPNLGIIAIIDQDHVEKIRSLQEFELDSIINYPIESDDLFLRLKEVRTHTELMEEVGVIGRTQEIRNIISTIIQIASTNVTVFITGESGTGKEVMAKAIHYSSSRRFKPFVAINCGAIAESLLESELFGYEKGAFTGAVSRTRGKFEYADKGTLFLDEVGEMSVNTQIKFLRVLEEREFMRVGGNDNIHVDVRVITATNADLEEGIRNGTFRRDLFYRLKVFSIKIPPLRERKNDIPLLINAFIEKFKKDHDLNFKGLTTEAYEKMKQYDWPGNIRELRNLVESFVILQPKNQISGSDIESYLYSRKPNEEFFHARQQHNGQTLPVFVNKPVDQVEREMIFQAVRKLHNDIQELKSIVLEKFEDTEKKKNSDNQFQPIFDTQINLDIGLPMKEIEKQVILKTLKFYRGNKKETADALEIGLRTLYRKLEQYQLETEEEKLYE